RAQPLADQGGFDVGAIDVGHWGVHLPHHAHEGHSRFRRDDKCIVGGHFGTFHLFSVVLLFMVASRASSLRKLDSAASRYPSIQAVSSSSAAGARWHGLRWPSRLRVIKPARSNTCRCLETACLVMVKGAASSLTVAGPVESRATRARRTGSANAKKALSNR